MTSHTRTDRNIFSRLRVALVQDSFSGRTISGGWGTASDGHDTWTFPIGSTTRAVSGGWGTLSGLASNTIAFLGSQTLADGEALMRVKATDTGSNLMLVLRATSSNTHYRAGFDGTGQINIQRVVGGTSTDLAPTSMPWSTNTEYWLHFRVQGSTLALKVWADSPNGLAGEPAVWSVTAFDTAITGPGQVGVRGKPASSSATLSFTALVVYQSLPFGQAGAVAARLMLSANKSPDTHMRLRALALALPQVPMRLVVMLVQNLVYGQLATRLSVAAQRALGQQSRLVLLAGRMRDLVGRVRVSSLTPLSTVLRFFLSIPKVAQWPNARTRFHLAYAQDSFQNRTITSGWGSASDGQSGSWTINNVNAVASVSGGTGQLTGTSGSITAFLGSTTLTDGEILVMVNGTNGNASLAAVLRATAIGTYYRAGLDGTNTVSIQKVVGGTITTLATGSFSWQAGYDYWVRFRVYGHSLLLKVWPRHALEPSSWALGLTDSSITGAGQYGIRSKAGSVGDTVYFSGLVVFQGRPSFHFSYVGARLAVLATGVRQMGTRLLLSSAVTRDLASRVHIALGQTKSMGTRLLLSLGTMTIFKTLSSRLRLSALQQADLGARIALLPGRQFFTALRLSLIAQAMNDVGARFLLLFSRARLSSGREALARVQMAYAQDRFVRANRSGSWGTTADGLSWSWTNSLTLSLVSNTGVMTGKGPSNMVGLLGTASLLNATVRTRTKLSNPGSSLAGGDACGVVVRATDATTYYRAGFTSNGAFTITRSLSGTITDLVTHSAANPTAGVRYWIVLRAIGPYLAARYWPDGTPEPASFSLSAYDTDITDAGGFGVRLKMNSSTSATISFDSFVVTEAAPSRPFGALLARLRLSSLTAPVVGMRFALQQTLVSPPMRDIMARLSVYTAHLRDATTRVRIAALSGGTGRSASTRARVRATGTLNMGARLFFAYAGVRTWKSRIRVAAARLASTSLRITLGASMLPGMRVRTLLAALSGQDTSARLVVYAPPGPSLIDPPPPDASSAPGAPERPETTPVALSALVTYAVNGVALVQQPMSATAPRLDGGAVQQGASFTLLFTNPSTALLAQLPDGAAITLTFALDVGTPMTAPVLLSSLVSPDGTLLTCTCTVTTMTTQNMWVVSTQFL